MEKALKILNHIQTIKKKTIKSATTTNESKKKNKPSDDKNFEDNLREVLQNDSRFIKHENSILNSNKEFRFYKMELFNNDKKEIIRTKYFDENSPCFFINIGKVSANANEILNEDEKNQDKEDYFIIDKDDLSTLYYQNSNGDIEDVVRGIEESNYTSGEATKFFITKDDEKNSTNPKEIFTDIIKFNLLSSQTISLIGKNDKIPDDFLKDYYAKGRLFWKGEIPYMLSFIKDNECSGKEGKFHYPMKSYYVKLTSMKGQIDAAFRSSSEIKLNDFKCDILYKKFETIPKDSTILFEFKNGKSGEKKVIAQAFKYQINAKYILNEEEYYHIIIINTKELGSALKSYIDENINEVSSLNNFAILCLNNSKQILGKELKSKSQNPQKLKEDSQSNPKIKPDKDSKISVICGEISTMKADIEDIKLNLKNLNKSFELMQQMQQTLLKLSNSIEEIKNSKNNSKDSNNNNNDESVGNKTK